MGTVGETLLGFHMCELCGISLAHVQHVDEIQSSGTRLQRNGLILIELWTKHTGQFAYPVIHATSWRLSWKTKTVSNHEQLQLTTTTSYLSMFQRKLYCIHTGKRLVVSKSELHGAILLMNLGSDAFWQRLLEAMECFVSNDAATGSCVQNGMCTEVFQAAIYRFGYARPCKRSAFRLDCGMVGLLIVRTFPGQQSWACHGCGGIWDSVKLLPSHVEFKHPTT